MSAPTIRSEQPIDRRHYLGSETFYVELHRIATLSDDLATVTNSDVDQIVIYLGDGRGHTRREDGSHNLRVGITVEMAEWLRSALDTALAETYKTRSLFVDGEVS